jgi:hypothetical protein
MVQLPFSAATSDDRATLAGSLAATRPAARELVARFEALLLQTAFAPLAKAIGFYGDTVVAVATRSMLRVGSPLTLPLEHAIDAETDMGVRK